ncbi:MAG: hypothetical protein AAB733_04840, partial [Patescibacteria group bacterium]
AQHPLFCSGFGTPVTFLTEDPRAISNGERIRRTYLLEWGLMGLWMKLGLLGIVTFYGWLGLLMVKTARMIRREVHGPLNPIAGAFLAATIGIIGVDFLTHYLNESVFLIWLVTMAAFIEAIRGDANSSPFGANE